MKQLILAFGLTAAILAAIVGFSLWEHNRPESSGKFEVTGTFVSAVVDGKQRMPSSDGFIIFKFGLRVSEAELARMSENNLNFPNVAWQVEGEQLWDVEVRSTGNWCGPLPGNGSLVTIKSNGFTSGVKITDLETGEVYKSTGKCSPAKTLFHYRAVREGTYEGVDKHDWSREVYDCKIDPACRMQVWVEGEEPPPLQK